MTTLDIWIKASVDMMEGNIQALKECGSDLDFLISQGKSFSKLLISFVDYLERQRKHDSR